MLFLYLERFLSLIPCLLPWTCLITNVFSKHHKTSCKKLCHNCLYIPVTYRIIIYLLSYYSAFKYSSFSYQINSLSQASNHQTKDVSLWVQSQSMKHRVWGLKVGFLSFFFFFTILFMHKPLLKYYWKTSPRPLQCPPIRTFTENTSFLSTRKCKS